MAITHFGEDHNISAHQNDEKVLQGGVACCAKNAANKPGLLRLDAVDDNGNVTAYYLWVDSNGKLRIHNAIPTDQDSDGTVVGTQS